MAYLSNQAAFSRSQSVWDNMSPPDDICPECGRESSCDCICDGFATDEELADAALELEIERMELEEIYNKGETTMMNMTEAKKALSGLYPNRYNSVKIEIVEYADGQMVAECTLYVDGLKHHCAATWEAAFDMLAVAESRTEEDIFQMAA